MSRNAHEHNPICPKCGYDQSGEIATWETQCPLQGLCCECGERFTWTEVYRILNEWESELDWYAEHAHGWVSMLRRTPGTLMRLLYSSKYFKGVNHRRAIRLDNLALWLVLVAVLLHLLVSPIGYLAHRVEGYAFARRGNDAMTVFLHTQLTEIPSAISYPFFFLYYGSNGYDMHGGPFAGYEWPHYMQLGFAMIGVLVFWLALIVFVLVLRHEPGTDKHRDRRQLIRIAMLNALPMIVYIQAIRLGFGVHVATGMTVATNWVPIAFLILLVAMLCWQQLLWINAVRSIWQFSGSFLINVSGCIGSVAFGIIFLGRLV